MPRRPAPLRWPVALALLGVGAWLEVVAASGKCDKAAVQAELITPAEVEKAQKFWASGFLKLASTCQESKNSKDAKNASAAVQKEAKRFVDSAYGFGVGGRTVLVKPTEAVIKPFRRCAEGVMSWLIGSEKGGEFTEDVVGFAKEQPWKKVWFENAQITVEGEQALAMGHYYFSNGTKGSELQLEFTFGFFRDSLGAVLANLHFSSRPFRKGDNATAEHPDITSEEVHDAIRNWGATIVSIAQRKERGWDYQGRTLEYLETSYSFPPKFFDFRSSKDDDDRANKSVILFKPADPQGLQIRSTFDAVMSYLVGTGKTTALKNDPGFALQDWESFDFEVAGLILQPVYAWAMGEYTFRSGSGKATPKAQFLFGFVRGRGVEVDGVMEGKLLVKLFHASFPHDAAVQKLGTVHRDLSPELVEESQERWGRFLAEVGAGFRTSEEFVDAEYAYAMRPVLFKPAEAVKEPFRFSREGAISYFGGGKSRANKEDWGFATVPFSSASFENDEVLALCDQAFAMGHVNFVDTHGNEYRAQFLWGWIVDPVGALRLRLQHTAFPDVKALKLARAEAAKQKKEVSQDPITKAEVEQYQDYWAAAVVKIGKANNTATARSMAKELVDQLYGFEEGPVLFKATEATERTRFRLTRLGVISYFAGGDAAFPADRGFALRPWVSVLLQNKGLLLEGGRAQAMGNIVLKDPGGIQVPLEYTMGYVRDVGGRLRLEVHYLSIPFDSKMNSTWDGVSAAFGGVGGAVQCAEKAASSEVKFTGEQIIRAGQAVQQNAWNIVAAIFGCIAVFFLAYFTCFWDSHASRSGLTAMFPAQLGSFGANDTARGVLNSGPAAYGGSPGGYGADPGGYGGGYGGSYGGGQSPPAYATPAGGPHGGGYQQPYDSWQQGPASSGSLARPPPSGRFAAPPPPSYGGRGRQS